jgi:PAS domain S-box-containing protein
MSSAAHDPAQRPHQPVEDLIVRRVRIGLGVIVAGILISMISEHFLMHARPAWAYGMDTLGMVFAGLALWLLTRPAIRHHPVPLALLVVALACAMRALSGIWFGDLSQTAILCVAVAMTAGATLPWGVRPQLATVVLAGCAIAANAYFIGGDLNDQANQFVVPVAIALIVSVVLAYELQLHRGQLAAENLRRQRAEADLARFNIDLEHRVEQRTAELAAAMQRSEREARERQQAALELAASQKRLQDILDNAPAAIHVKDLDGRYVLVNRHAETIIGLQRDELLGKSIYEVLPSDTADALRANDRSVLAARAPLQFEETLRLRDGLHTFISVKFPLFDADGAPMGVCGISTDITVRNHMEAELRRSEAALSALVENTTDSIWSVDRDGVIQVMNSVFRRRFRERYGVDYSRSVSETVVPQPIWDDLYALYAHAFRGEHVQVERTIPLDGEPQHFLISVHPIIENGAVSGATVFSKDITERKRVEAQARQHQAELAHVLRLGTMGEMAAGLAHEINQPLGAIANYAQGCVHRLRSGSNDAAALLPIVEQIAREALRAGEIIRRLRELVRKESPQQQVVDLNTLVRKSVQMIESEARQHDIRLQLVLAPDLPAVGCDPIQIEQVLLNLLRNGVEAVQIARNGERALVITTAANGANGVAVSICDSGAGIPEPPIDVFAPFFSTKPQGLGMGLSISRSIIEAHSGRLSATRNPDRGSTFRFTLPADLRDDTAGRPGPNDGIEARP